MSQLNLETCALHLGQTRPPQSPEGWRRGTPRGHTSPSHLQGERGGEGALEQLQHKRNRRPLCTRATGCSKSKMLYTPNSTVSTGVAKLGEDTAAIIGAHKE